MAMAASSSASACAATHNHDQHDRWKYDVFLSFRGADTRDTFISHLLAALSAKGLEAFIDYQLRKGDEIAPALLQAIQESNMAIVVFSENYASSSWCLDELVKIMECRETQGQIVIPVFYNLNPSDVRKQTGSFAEASAFKQKRNFEINSEKVPKWKAALTGAANLSGWDSKVIRPEHKLIDQIAKDVMEKLVQALPLPIGLERLVGINSRLEEIKNVLSIGSLDVRILGIWGMGGIGKTTIAEVIFSQISCQFEGCCFLKNVREEWDRGDRKKLIEELISKTLGHSEIKLNMPSIGIGQSLARRLYRKRILVVLDDVDNPLQLEYFVGDPCWFGPGSRIILTSRNKHAIERRANHIYEVQKLSYNAALQLFSQNAFNQYHPPEDHMPLSDLVVRYSQGNPLALKVLGSFLFGKEKNEWESAVDKLRKVPMREIQSVLKISYDGLDREEKEIFLHIACFFKGEKGDFVKQILNNCSFSTNIGIRDLIDKSLITTTTIMCDELGVLDMHDLLQEMAREIVREESKEPGERSRLWDSEDIYKVFMKNTGTAKVEGIFLNMSTVRREIHLNPKTFESMSNLKFLKVYNSKDFGGLQKQECKVHLSQGLDHLPNELRYLYWYGYPLEYLPKNFQPENPVWIELPRSNIKSLQKEAVPESSFKHFSSSSQFSMVTCIRLVNCKELMGLPKNIDMGCLDTLDLTGCSRLETFPEVSRNIRYLYLCGTAIKEVPSSVEYLHRLVVLSLFHCTELGNLPTNICKLTCLKSVDLSCCSKLKTFPEIWETMDNLEILDLSWTAIEELPSSVDNLKALKRLRLVGCTKLTFLPQSLGNLKALHEFMLSTSLASAQKIENYHILRFIGQAQMHALPSLPLWWGMSCLTLPSVGDGNLWQLTANLGFLSSLKYLNLSGNNFESISGTIKQLTQLEYLGINNCQKLKSLPELPVSLSRIYASGCTSLETITSLDQLLFEAQSLHHEFDFSNCFKLEKNKRDPISQLRNRYLEEQLKEHRGGKCSPSIFICYPGGRIPELFVHQSVGDSIKIPLPSNWLSDAFLGFALCLVLEDVESLDFECHCHFGHDCDDNCDFTFALKPMSLSVPGFPYSNARTEHVVLVYDGKLYDVIAENRPRLTQFSYNALLLNFQLLKVTKCGVTPLYAKDEKYNSTSMSVGQMDELSESS